MVLALAVPPPSGATDAATLAREAMALGPRIESLRVQRAIIKAGAVPTIVAAVARSVREDAAGPSLGNTMGSSSRGGSHLGPPPVWERPTIAAMKLLKALSREVAGAEQMLSAEGLPAVLGNLGLPLGQPLLSMAVETAWNLLEASPVAAAAALSTKETIGLLVDLHQRTLVPGTGDADKELRNEVLVLSTLLAKYADADGRNVLVRGGLYKSALELVCADSARLVGASELNLELLLMALQFLNVMSTDAVNLPETAPIQDDEAGLCDAVLDCLQPSDPGNTLPADTVAVPIASEMWSGAQRLELKKRAFKLLTNLAVAYPEKVCEMQPMAIADILAAHLHLDAPAPLRDAAIHLLVAALPKSPGLQQAAGECGVVGQLTELVAAISYCGSPTSLAPFSTMTVHTTSALKVPTGLDANAMQAAVLALALLCQDQPDNMARFGDAGGVACLMPLIKPRTDSALLHSVIECVWSAIVPSAENVSKLVQRDGVLLLLSVLEGAPFAPRAHVLSAISDLIAASPDALEQCREWHGKSRQSATQLCLQLWHEESVRRGSVAASGRITSTTRPLSDNAQKMYADLNASLQIPTSLDGISQMKSHAGVDADDETFDIGDASSTDIASALKLTSATSLAIAGRLEGVKPPEAPMKGTSAALSATLKKGATGEPLNGAMESVDVRSKLFSVLNSLDFSSSVEMTNEERLLLTAAKEYIPFATGEAWRDAIDEFATSGLEPLEEDQAKLDARLVLDEQMAAGVQAKQGETLAVIAAEEKAGEVADTKRVRVLRDGPMAMYPRPSARRASSAHVLRRRRASATWSPRARSDTGVLCRRRPSTRPQRSRRRRRRCSSRRLSLMASRRSQTRPLSALRCGSCRRRCRRSRRPRALIHHTSTRSSPMPESASRQRASAWRTRRSSRSRPEASSR